MNSIFETLRKLRTMQLWKLNTLDKTYKDKIVNSLKGQKEFNFILQNSGEDIDPIVAMLASFPNVYPKETLILWDTVQSLPIELRRSRLPMDISDRVNDDKTPKNKGNWNAAFIRKTNSAKRKKEELLLNQSIADVQTEDDVPIVKKARSSQDSTTNKSNKRVEPIISENTRMIKNTPIKFTMKKSSTNSSPAVVSPLQPSSTFQLSKEKVIEKEEEVEEMEEEVEEEINSSPVLSEVSSDNNNQQSPTTDNLQLYGSNTHSFDHSPTTYNNNNNPYGVASTPITYIETPDVSSSTSTASLSPQISEDENEGIEFIEVINEAPVVENVKDNIHFSEAQEVQHNTNIDNNYNSFGYNLHQSNYSDFDFGSSIESYQNNSIDFLNGYGDPYSLLSEYNTGDYSYMDNFSSNVKSIPFTNISSYYQPQQSISYYSNTSTDVNSPMLQQPTTVSIVMGGNPSLLTNEYFY